MKRTATAIGVSVLLGCAKGDPELAYWRALNASDDGRHDLARSYLNEYRERRQGDPLLEQEVLRALGRAWMQGALQSPGQARPVWQELVEQLPTDEEALLALARVEYLLGDSAAAVDILEREALPESDARDSLLAAALLQLDPVAALEWAVENLERGRGGALVAAQAAELIGDEPSLLQYSRLAVEEHPLDPSAHYLLSRALLRAGDRPGAAAEARLHTFLKRLAAPEGATRETALERLRVVDQVASELEGASTRLRSVRLDLLVEAGLRQEASQALAEARTDTQLGRGFRLQLAGWAERLGELETARALLEVELESTQEPRRRRLLQHRLARLYRSMDENLALDFLRAAIREQPRVARFHCALGGTLVARGASREAVAAYEGSLELAPWRADCRVELARLFQAEGRRREVSDLLRVAPEPAPELRAFREDFGYLEQ